MNIQPYATIDEMATWARDVMDRAPDLIIGEEDNPYLLRWWVLPRNEGCNVYLHRILRSDIDEALHDHPWDNTSMLIEGRYLEHTPDGQFLREAGSSVARKATDSHRLEILPGEAATSLFFTGPKLRDWGFHCPRGGVPWQKFVDPGDYGLVGKGCNQ